MATSAAVCLLTLTSCSGDSGEAGQAEPAATAGSSSAGDDTAATATGEPTAADAGPPIGSRTETLGSATVRADLLPLQLSDGALTVMLRLTTVEGGPAELGNSLSDGDINAADSLSWAPDGITVVDGTNKRVHLTASDGDGTCFCTPRDLGIGDLPTGSSLTVTALFAAPPADVTTVDVAVPTFGTFGDVSVG